MNRKIITGIILAVAVLMLLLLNKEKSPFGKSNSSFAIDPKNEITEIELALKEERLVLEKKDHNWFMNENIEIRKNGINFIIRILQDIEIKSPVSAELFEKEISENETEPVRVRVFEKKKLLRTFLVYKTRSNIYGNIMKMKGSSKPFIVYVPGFEGDIGSAFTLNELFWQPYTIFNLLPSEIASVHFENLSDTTSSFAIFNKNNEYTLSDLNRVLEGWDTSRVTRYLSYFARIPFESWDMELTAEEKEKVKSQTPLFRITLNSTDGHNSVLTLWEKLTEENGKIVSDKDRLFGKTGDRDDLFVVRYFDIDPVLKKRSYFFRN